MRDRRPLYAQVAKMIKTDFSGGSSAETVRLPGESALAERYKVSRTTVREAYRLLEQEGSIVARHGVGTFLSSQSDGVTFTFGGLAPGLNIADSVRDGTRPVLIGCTLLTLSQALRSRFDWPGDTLLRLERLHKMDDTPRCFSVDVMPAVFVGGVIDEGSLDRPLKEILSGGGFTPHYADSLLTAVIAPARVCKEAAIFAGRPVVRSQEFLYDRRGQVLAICLQYQDASTLRFRVRRKA